MKFNPPKKTTVYVSLVIVVLGLIAFFVPSVKGYSFWVLLIGYVYLLAGLMVKGF
jgi:uncharacterized membrane protein HdeD (DUF308 family)